MASKVFRLFATDFPGFRSKQVRHGHFLRGKPPTVARTLQQRLELLNQKDPTIAFTVDIGLPVPKFSKTELSNTWMKEYKSNRRNQDLEKKSRTRQLLVDLQESQRVWSKTEAPFHICKIAEHYGIFRDLYGDAYFKPVVQLEIDYWFAEDIAARVYTGNVVKPTEARQSPSVNYDADSNTLWTLLMTTPDGNMQNSSNEYCHWFVGNIPGNAIDKGEQVLDYMRPIPVQGAGYYRYIFVLYKQDKPLDFTEYKKAQPCLKLRERDWNTLEFYRKHQDHLTPAGLAFFQADWDPSVKEFYHSVLGTCQPVFQYDFPKPYVKPQTWFPLRQPFNLYMDRYRDPKQITKEYLLKKLKDVHPFKGSKPPLKYPNAYSLDKNIPSWLKLEMKKDRLGWGRINDIQ